MSRGFARGFWRRGGEAAQGARVCGAQGPRVSRDAMPARIAGRKARASRATQCPRESRDARRAAGAAAPPTGQRLAAAPARPTRCRVWSGGMLVVRGGMVLLGWSVRFVRPRAAALVRVVDSRSALPRQGACPSMGARRATGGRRLRDGAMLRRRPPRRTTRSSYSRSRFRRRVSTDAATARRVVTTTGAAMATGSALRWASRGRRVPRRRSRRASMGAATGTAPCFDGHRDGDGRRDDEARRDGDGRRDGDRAVLRWAPRWRRAPRRRGAPRWRRAPRRRPRRASMGVARPTGAATARRVVTTTGV